MHSSRFLARAVVASVFALVLSAATVSTASAGSDPTPGTRPAAQLRANARVQSQSNQDGLQLVVNERGHVSKSEAATAGGQLTISKPAGATVRGAYLGYATTGFTYQPLTTPITLLGRDVPLTNELANGIGGYNYFAEVTDLVKSTIDGAPAGQVRLSVSEPEPWLVDGEVLTVIYDDPSLSVERTVSIMYGALQPGGDTYSVHLARPINLADPATRLQMSLGISYSYQTGGSQQYSTVDVNGSRLTSSAGGEDDGAPYNGALITAGGEGDSIDNPVDPQASPTDPRSDDELYDLRPFVRTGDSTIKVDTDNPSYDDNVFLAVFDMNPPVTDVVTGNGPAAQVLILHGVTQSSDVHIFSSLVDKVRAQAPDATVNYFSYFQDKSGQLPDGSCDTASDTQIPPLIPPEDAGLPYDTSQNSTYCDSEGDIGQNAVRLDDTIKRLYESSGQPVILVGYSMGGETIRSFLAYSTQRQDGVADGMVDSVVTIHGVQQGSWLSLGSYALDGLPPWAQGPVKDAVAHFAPDPDRLATREFSPVAPYLHWVHANSGQLPDVPYYNTWGDEHLVQKHCVFFGHLCQTYDPGSWGDVVLKPGTDGPTENTTLGGERFAPRGYTDSSWQWREPFYVTVDPFSPLSEVGGVKALLGAPQQHSNIPNKQADVPITDCRTGAQIAEDQMLADAISARLLGGTLACDPTQPH